MRSSVVVLMLLLFTGCGMFDLKTAEPPLDEGTGDPLMMSEVLRAARETTGELEYTDCFTDNAVFEYSLEIRRIYGKEKIINMLEFLRPQASYVDWQTDKATKKVEGDLLIFENMPYLIYFDGTLLCSGKADFHINMGIDWQISYWKDVPDDYRNSFFEP